MHDLVDSPPRIFQTVESGKGSTGRSRLRVNFKGNLRDNPERPFRAHKEPCQVISGYALHGFRTCSHDPAVRENYLKAQDIIPGCAVFCSFESPGIGGHIPSQCADLSACRIRGEKKSKGGESLFEININDPRLNNCQTIFYTNFHNMVHAAQIQDNPSFNRDRHTGKACPGTPGDNRNLFPVGKLQYFRYLIRGLGPDSTGRSVAVL